MRCEPNKKAPSDWSNAQKDLFDLLNTSSCLKIVLAH